MAGYPDSSASIFVVVFFVVLILRQSPRVNSNITEDRQALLAFIEQIDVSNRVSWPRNSTSPCNWTGVECAPAGDSVHSVRLPGVALVGNIPANTLGNLSQLRILSLRSNALTGHIPPDFSGLSHLRRLYLQDNKLSGEIPANVGQLTRLVRLDLSFNNFSGAVPFALNKLTNLTGLFLENNSFSGPLPNIDLKVLSALNVSNNHLNGSIPPNLSTFNESSFRGNIDLCGPPLAKPCGSFFPSPAPSPSVPSPPRKTSKSKLSKAAIIAISVGSALILLLLLLLLLLCLRRRYRSQPAKTPAAAGTRTLAAGEAGPSLSKDDLTGGSSAAEEAERNKLVFFQGGVYSFDLEDLLRASAEVLGKGSVGTSYKAVLAEGTTVVVKRLKDVAASKKEFETQMGVLGRIRHENVVPLRAFYYSSDEKLLVFDYMAAGSLSALLHGSRGSGRTPLDWDSRMRIAVSAARGLGHLHLSAGVVHGNIKSSNVLLRPDHEAALADFGLHVLFGSAAPPNRVAGYRAPEAVETRRVTAKSDVYSFGVLLLELLTGKAPNQASLGEEGIDLPRWVQSVVREEWTAEVFDSELMRYNNIEEEMVQLLQIAMACVATVPDQRPEMREVVRMVEDVSRGGGDTTDDGLRQSSDEPSRDSGAPTPP